MAFNFDGKIFLVKEFGQKLHDRIDFPFTCGFCRKVKGERERYTTLGAQAPNGDAAGFIFCAPCSIDAMDKLPDAEPPAGVRAIISKIESEGAISRQY